MNGYGTYNAGYNGGSMDQHHDDGGTNVMQMMGPDGMGGMAGGMVGGQTLDDIVNQNAKMIRRQSMPVGQNYNASPHHMNPDMRRISMMDYGANSPAGSMSSFQYDPNAGMDGSGFASGGVTPANNQQPRRTHSSRRPSGGELSLDTSFQNQQNYTSMMGPGSAMATSPAHVSATMDMSGIQSNSYIDNSMSMNIDDYGVDANGLNSAMSQDPMQMNLYAQPQFNPSNFSSPMHPSQQQGGVTPQSGRLSSHDAGGGSGQHSQYGGLSNTQATPGRQQLSRTQSLQVPDHLSSPAHGASPQHGASPMGAPMPAHTSGPPLQSSLQHTSSTPSRGFVGQNQHPVPGSSEDRGIGRQFDGLNGPVPVKGQNYNPNNQNFPWDMPEGGWPSTMVGKPHMQSVYKNAYSSTGFDMLGVLVGQAKNAQVE